MWNLKKPNSWKQIRMVVTRGWKGVKWGDVGQNVHTSSYKTIKFWGSKFKIIDLKCSHHKNEMIIM